MKSDPGDRERAVLMFDLTMVPATACVAEATLTLHTNSPQYRNAPECSSTTPVYVHTVTMPWDELTSSWANHEANSPWCDGTCAR